MFPSLGPQNVPLHFRHQKIAFKLFVWLVTGLASQARPQTSRSPEGWVEMRGLEQEWGRGGPFCHQVSGESPLPVVRCKWNDRVTSSPLQDCSPPLPQAATALSHLHLVAGQPVGWSGDK